MNLLIFFIILPLGIGCGIGMMYKAYTKKNRLDDEIYDKYKRGVQDDVY
jgi:hypothetical protein